MTVRTAANSDTFKATTPSDREIVLTRLFDAPRGLVFEAMTKPEHVKRWWGILDDENYSLPVCEIDLRVGGKWRYMSVTDGGFEVAFHGEYLEIVPDERLVSTEIYEIPEQGDSPPTVNTATFTEVDGRTTLTVLVQCPSKELRDTIIESGMESGMQDAMDLLEEVAATS
jgi:uncharacterized protein YndB with AHSA1/START domain